METTVLEPDTTTDVVTQPVTLAPMPLPSQLFRDAIADGWELRHGYYAARHAKQGCALGALLHGMHLAGLDGPAYDRIEQRGVHGRILTVFPQLGNKVVSTINIASLGLVDGVSILMHLEYGYERIPWDEAQCIAFLEKQGC